MFDFIKFIQPLWYYRLAYKMPHSVLLDRPSLDSLVAEGRILKGEYRSQDSVYSDLAYLALQMSFVPNRSIRSDIQDTVIYEIADNYRFIFRQFGKWKALFVLFWRILNLNNPIREISAFINNMDVKVSLLYSQNMEGLFEFDFKAESKISVIIPTLNRYEFLKDVLSDLEKQTYKNFEVWICDQSDDFNAGFYKGWNLDLKLIRQEEKALWRARNRCIEASKGEYILFFDDDSRVEKNWIYEHLKVVKSGYISAGITDTLTGGGRGLKSDFFHVSEMLDTGNVMFERSIFDNLGFFDEKFERMRMGDGEYGLRCLLSGFPIVSNPKAGRIHLKGESGGLRQMGAWDAIHSIGIFKPRPIPSSLYLARKHFDSETALIYGFSQLPKSLIPYKLKGSGFIKKMPYVFGSIILSPILLLTFWMSWRKSTEMLGKNTKCNKVN